jgi:hypothetical protein
VLFQDPAESNYGVPLKPGDYLQISSYTARETCVYPTQGGLDAAGDLVYPLDVTGVLATPSLAEVETQYGVLADQLQQSEQRLLVSCRLTQQGCDAAFGASAEPLFAKFANELVTDAFPPRVSNDDLKLEATARTVALFFGRVQTASMNRTTLFASLRKYGRTLNSQFNALVRDLSKH